MLLPANAVEDEASYVRVAESAGELDVSCGIVLVVWVLYAATDDEAN